MTRKPIGNIPPRTQDDGIHLRTFEALCVDPQEIVETLRRVAGEANAYSRDLAVIGGFTDIRFLPIVAAGDGSSIRVAVVIECNTANHVTQKWSPVWPQIAVFAALQPVYQQDCIASVIAAANRYTADLAESGATNPHLLPITTTSILVGQPNARLAIIACVQYTTDSTQVPSYPEEI